MKLNKLVTKVKKELKNDKEKAAVGIIKTSLRRIESGKKTLRMLEKAHKDLMKKDLDEIELDNFVY